MFALAELLRAEPDDEHVVFYDRGVGAFSAAVSPLRGHCIAGSD